jgi:hypothetical protein
LQLLNEVNSRRINDELNVFEGIHKSPIFLGVLLVTAGLQVRLTGVRCVGLVLQLTSVSCGCCCSSEPCSFCCLQVQSTWVY